jgi:LysR family glycine cleavage system transcriptional activator
MSFSLPRRLLPPLPALLAFEAAARLESFTQAAAELNQTQGAVSRQVKLLEEQLGILLFQRVRQRVSLTEAGRFYAAEIRTVLRQFARATAETIAFRGQGGTLNLAILPSFGTRWLIPRMPSFFARHRDILVNFSTRLRPFDFAREGLDAAIHFGDPAWPGATLHKLMGETLVPVASPALIARSRLAEPAEILRETLLIQATRPHAWQEWFAAQGLYMPPNQPALSFEQFTLVLQAAVAGLGIAIVPTVLVRTELEAGELVVLSEASVESRQGYFLAYPTENADFPPLAAFREWLLEESRTAAPA